MIAAEPHRRAPMAVLFFCVLLAGCMTTRNFEALPSEPPHFKMPRGELEAEFPEVPLYEDTFRGFSPNTPLANTLTEKWGEPDCEKKEWVYLPWMGITLGELYVLTETSVASIGATAGLLLLIRPLPPKSYFWQKGRYCIIAKIDRTFPTYKERIMYWKWTDISGSEPGEDSCCTSPRKPLEEEKPPDPLE